MDSSEINEVLSQKPQQIRIWESHSLKPYITSLIRVEVVKNVLTLHLKDSDNYEVSVVHIRDSGTWQYPDSFDSVARASNKPVIKSLDGFDPKNFDWL